MRRWPWVCTNTVTLFVAVFVCLGVGNPPVISVEAFVDRVRFDQAHIIQEQKANLKTCASVRGALVNHHVLASDLLEHLFQRLALCGSDITRVIILSPDHYFQGQTPISTGVVRYIWKRKFIDSDEDAVRALTKTKIATSNQKLFRREHGVGALIPFMMEAFPGAKIVPIMVRSDVSKTEAKQLSAWVNLLLDEKTLLIVSSDMSHYLPERTALQKDQQTLTAFEKQSTSFFWSANDDHLDFGKGVWIALKALRPDKFELLDHSISSRYGGSSANTTSYITGVWE
jgi:poly-gamma-glutamate synthesis protein (capsule biosynthesis protein)